MSACRLPAVFVFPIPISFVSCISEAANESPAQPLQPTLLTPSHVRLRQLALLLFMVQLEFIIERSRAAICSPALRVAINITWLRVCAALLSARSPAPTARSQQRAEKSALQIN